MISTKGKTVFTSLYTEFYIHILTLKVTVNDFDMGTEELCQSVVLIKLAMPTVQVYFVCLARLFSVLTTTKIFLKLSVLHADDSS